MKPKAYLIFHLNLAFSSIPEESRLRVIQRCYHPLLQLAETTGIPIGVELTGWTLERIKELDPGWVAKFTGLLQSSRCELIGSGYAQLIGPLVPYKVNFWNQRLGLEVYARELGIVPRIAFVNEMAFSSSLIDVYSQAGYQGIVMDRDNVRLALGIEDQPIANVPTHGVGPDGASLPVLWADSILFQRLQHFVHGDIRQADYLDYLRKRLAAGDKLLPLYANDAEIFDFRPGRFSVESPTHPEGEWSRLESLLKLLTDDSIVEWRAPSEVIEEIEQSDVRHISSLVSAAQPMPVKKQAKYNIARWAVTGRNSTWLNSMCHRLAGRLSSIPTDQQDPDDWKLLCSLWASDLRTHITPERWADACKALNSFAARLSVSTSFGQESPTRYAPRDPDGTPPPGFLIERDAENILLSIETNDIRLVLNLRRGLSIHSLAFRAHDFVPIVGTLAHGFFNEIALGADFYSGGAVIELPAEHARVTDLDRVEPEITWADGEVKLRANIATRLGNIVKTIEVPASGQRIELEISFPGWSKPHGKIHVGSITLMPEAFTGLTSLRCANGGASRETFKLSQAFDHTAPSASLVSCNAGFGATDGEIDIGDDRRRLSISWDPARCAILPMLMHKGGTPHPLTRLFFSMQEFDDTTRPGGMLGSVRLRLGVLTVDGSSDRC